jgi:prepilin-type N-terminal cleavage/methylation domain-containing protein
MTIGLSQPPPPRSRPALPNWYGRHGFTLTELLVSIALIAMLASIALAFNWSKIRNRIERTGCEGNLKTLYAGFSNYLSEYGEWPQIPETANLDGGEGEENYWQFWIGVMKQKDYGVSESHWLCPTDRRERAASQKPEERDKFEGSYIPTEFDAGPDSPRAWRQPWFLERTDFHGDGALMIMPDGSIQPAPWTKF